MNAKTTLLFAALMPGLIAFTACDRADNDAGDTATPTADAVGEGADMDAAPADPMPAGDVVIEDSAMSFAQMDANGDGGVSMDELSPTEMLHVHFSVADADNDGLLTETEIEQHRSDMAADEPRQ